MTNKIHVNIWYKSCDHILGSSRFDTDIEDIFSNFASSIVDSLRGLDRWTGRIPHNSYVHAIEFYVENMFSDDSCDKWQLDSIGHRRAIALHDIDD